MLAGGQAERQSGMRLAGATVAEGDDVVAGDDIFAARRNKGEVPFFQVVNFALSKTFR